MKRQFHGHPQRPAQQQQTPQSTQEKPAMTFEVNENEKGNGHQGDQSRQHADQGTEVTRHDVHLALRARQAALDVVLDGMPLLRAQSRLMSVVDSNDWKQAFVLTKAEVERHRTMLTEGASFEELVRLAEDAGEDMVALAERLNVTFESIADALDNRDTVKI
ncbi:hypothetical protein D3C85_239010 [compost metagenome]